MPDTFIKLPDPKVKEYASFVATAYFRDSSDAAGTPTTVDYRIDNITTGTKVLDWTSVTPGTSVSITVKATENKIISGWNKYEKQQLTVSSDRGTTTETRDTAMWKVVNIPGFTET